MHNQFLKKFRTAAAVLFCTAICGLQVSAQETRQTIVSYTVPEMYTVMIPESLEIPFNAESTSLSVSLTATNLGQKKVIVEAAESGALMNSASHQLPFAVTENARLAFDALETKDMTIGIARDDWKTAPAGEYSGTLTFEISVE